MRQEDLFAAANKRQNIQGAPVPAAAPSFCKIPVVHPPYLRRETIATKLRYLRLIGKDSGKEPDRWFFVSPRPAIKIAKPATSAGE